MSKRNHIVPQVGKNGFGTWTVTTQGDEEGRTTRHLGTYTGTISEIAFALAGSCYYSLTFKISDHLPSRATGYEVNVIVDHMYDNHRDYDDTENLLKDMQDLVGDHVTVEKSNYYHCVKLIMNQDEQDKLKKMKALDKLTEEEKVLLGIKGI